MSNLIYNTLAAKYPTATITKKEAATELQIGTTKLDELRKLGEINFIKVGSQIRFRLTDIAEFLE